jgi:hypothetical protein
MYSPPRPLEVTQMRMQWRWHCRMLAEGPAVSYHSARDSAATGSSMHTGTNGSEDMGTRRWSSLAFARWCFFLWLSSGSLQHALRCTKYHPDARRAARKEQNVPSEESAPSYSHDAIFCVFDNATMAATLPVFCVRSMAALPLLTFSVVRRS